MKTALLLTFLFFFTAAAPAETAQSLIDRLRNAVVPSGGAAQRSIDDLRELSKDLPELQLVSADKLDELSRGQSFPIAIVELDRLRTWDPGAEPDPMALLVPKDRAFHFVATSNADEISGVEVMKEDGEWIPARLGLTPLADGVQATLHTLDVSPKNAMLIEIPAFRLWFVGYDQGGSMMVAAIESAPELEIVKSVSRPLEAVLQSLVPSARDHNGLSS